MQNVQCWGASRNMVGNHWPKSLHTLVYIILQLNWSCCIVLRNVLFICKILYVFMIIWIFVQKHCLHICQDRKLNIHIKSNIACTIDFLKHWSQTQFLEGHSSAEFSSNQLQITPAWKILVILKTLINWIRCVWLGLELNCAELWPSRNWEWDRCLKALQSKVKLKDLYDYSYALN